MNWKGIDHIVFTVQNIQATLHFYCHLLDMKEITFGKGRKAILCGNQKFNLHEKGKELEPKALHPTPGAIDLCLIINTPLQDVIKRLEEHDIKIIEGPVEKTGAQGKILSLYLRDPDQNLVEISNYI